MNNKAKGIKQTYYLETKLIVEGDRFSLDERINDFLDSREMKPEDLIDIKYQDSSALIIFKVLSED